MNIGNRTVATPWWHIWLIFVEHITSGSAVIMLTMLSGLVGVQLAPSHDFATLPSTTTVIGTLAGILPFSYVIRRTGWKIGLAFGIAVGMAGVVVAAAATILASFWLYLCGCFLIGLMSASVQYHIFAAADLCGDERKAFVVSLITCSGLFSAFLAPALIRLGHLTSLDNTFSASFAMLGVALAISLALLLAIRFPSVIGSLGAPKLSLKVASLGSPLAVCGVLIAAGGFSSMTLLMHSAPIALSALNCSVDTSSSIMQWHFVAMYAPSIFAAPLIRRMGSAGTVLVGVLFGCAAAFVAAFWATNIPAYYVVLVFIGVAWSFMFTAGMNMLIDGISAADRTSAQGTANLVIYGINALTSFSAAPVLTHLGWNGLALVTLIPLALVVASSVSSAMVGTSKRSTA